jgi:hypothetical protein
MPKQGSTLLAQMTMKATMKATMNHRTKEFTFRTGLLKAWDRC